MSVAAKPQTTTAPSKINQSTTVHCYSLFDKFFPTCGLFDYTEGIYNNDPSTPYEDAQRNQINYVLDEVRCTKGVRILEIGCGNGTVLEEVRRRDAIGVGVTISPEQVRLCRQRGLDARLLDYKDIDDEWDGQFDAVVANGPMEHFVSPTEAAQNRADEIYRRFFEICHRAIDPQSSNRRFINTTIYFVRPPDPTDLLKSPFSFPRGSDSSHYAWLARSFGGFYPLDGQLQRCANGYFDLVKTVDGTYDYHLTSEYWLQHIRSQLKTPKAFKIFWKSLPFIVRHPKQFMTMMTCMLVTESWNWQFRSPDAPTKLFRQTWEYHSPEDDQRAVEDQDRRSYQAQHA